MRPKHIKCDCCGNSTGREQMPSPVCNYCGIFMLYFNGGSKMIHVRCHRIPNRKVLNRLMNILRSAQKQWKIIQPHMKSTLPSSRRRWTTSDMCPQATSSDAVWNYCSTGWVHAYLATQGPRAKAPPIRKIVHVHDNNIAGNIRSLGKATVVVSPCNTCDYRLALFGSYAQTHTFYEDTLFLIDLAVLEQFHVFF